MTQLGLFTRISRGTAYVLGHPGAFWGAVAIVVLWAAAGPVFRFSDTWQLTINTGTTIVTFLMVFLIQHTQNHQGDAVQLKLDELIRAMEGAHNRLVNLEEASEEELAQLRERYRALAAREREAVGKDDTGVADLGGPQAEEAQGPARAARQDTAPASPNWRAPRPSSPDA